MDIKECSKKLDKIHKEYGIRFKFHQPVEVTLHYTDRNEIFQGKVVRIFFRNETPLLSHVLKYYGNSVRGKKFKKLFGPLKSDRVIIKKENGKYVILPLMGMGRYFSLHVFTDEEIWASRDCKACGGMSGCGDCGEVTKDMYKKPESDFVHPIIGQEAVVPKYGLGRVVSFHFDPPNSHIEVRPYICGHSMNFDPSNVELVHINYQLKQNPRR